MCGSFACINDGSPDQERYESKRKKRANNEDKHLSISDLSGSVLIILNFFKFLFVDISFLFSLLLLFLIWQVEPPGKGGCVSKHLMFRLPRRKKKKNVLVKADQQVSRTVYRRKGSVTGVAVMIDLGAWLSFFFSFEPFFISFAIVFLIIISIVVPLSVAVPVTSEWAVGTFSLFYSIVLWKLLHLRRDSSGIIVEM
jgi:hypothetical protein